MAVPQDTQIRESQTSGYGFYFLSGIVIVLCLQGLIYLLLIGNTVGSFSIFHKERPPDPALARELKVALLRSEASARLFPENPEGYYDLERHWERVLKREGIPFRLVSDAQLAHDLGDAGVLVLPGGSCLGEAQRRTIRHFLEAGKGIVASGPLGSRNANCVWQGWDLLSTLTGAQRVYNATPPTTVDVAFRGQRFFSEQVPTGYRLEIPSQDLTLVATEEPDAFWSDGKLRPAEGNRLSDVALAVHSTYGAGRFVWFGFNALLPVEQVVDQATVNHYMVSAIRWVGKQPMAVLGNWPNKNRAAVLIVDDTQHNYPNSESSARILKQAGVPAIFLCDSTEAQQNPAAVESFRSLGEVASLGDTLEPFTGQLPLRQAERLRLAKRDLEKIGGGRVLGFAPPHGLSDTATVVALNDAGYRYYLNEMAVTRAVPEIVEFTGSVFFPFQKSEVTKVFRTSSDDFEVIANYHGPSGSSPEIAEGFLSDFRRMFYLSGVYTFYFHSYLLGAPEYRDVLKRIVDNIKAQPVWITRGQDLVDWWSARSKVEVEASKVSIRRIRLDVANKGQSAVDNASVYLYLPYRPKRVQMSAVVFHLRPPHYQMLDHDDILQVDFPRLSAQTNYTYVVHLDE